MSSLEDMGLPQANIHTLPVDAPKWVLVLHDDPVNLVNYVRWVLETCLGFEINQAYQKTMEVHKHGRAVLAAGRREQMEQLAQLLHTHGLWATIEPEQCS